MSIDQTWLFLSLIPSGMGLVLVLYGRKLDRWPHLAAGLALMAYPYLDSTRIHLTPTRKRLVPAIAKDHP